MSHDRYQPGNLRLENELGSEDGKVSQGELEEEVPTTAQSKRSAAFDPIYEVRHRVQFAPRDKLNLDPGGSHLCVDL
jgi:hypothetical protein